MRPAAGGPACPHLGHRAVANLASPCGVGPPQAELSPWPLSYPLVLQAGARPDHVIRPYRNTQN